MKEQKLKNAILCLYAVGITQIVMTAYGIFASLQTMIALNKLESSYPGALPDIGIMGSFGFSTVFSVMTLVLLYYVIQDLKKQKAWAWVGAISTFVISAFSLAIPFCIIGLISLLHEDVRNEFIQKLDIKI